MSDSASPSDRSDRQRGKFLWPAARIGVGCYVLWCIVLTSCQTGMIFPRELAGRPMPDASIPRAAERWWITAADGSKVEAWYFPPRIELTEGNKPAPCAVIFHGNGELIDHITDYAEWYRQRGYAALLPEYRGYGRSGGAPGQAAITQDMLAFHAQLIARPEVDASRLVYHGRSLGSAVATQLAEQRPPAALVLESPFLSINAMAARYFVPGFLVRHPYRTDRVLPSIGRPSLILHSTDDEIIPYSHGRRLHELTPGSTLIDLSGSHNSSLSSLPQYWSSVDDFLRQHVEAPR